MDELFIDLKKIIFRVVIVTLYLKFVFQMILDSHLILLDFILYVSILFLLIPQKITISLAVVLLFVCISFFNPSARNFFLILGITYASRIYTMKQLISMNLCLQLLVFITTCFLLWYGTTHSEMFFQTAMDQRERWDFGYGNPNVFALFIYSILVNIYLLIYDKKYVSPVLVVLFILVILPVYNYTHSRTFLLAFLMLIMTHFVVIKQRIKLLIRVKIVLYLMPAIILLFILMVVDNMSEYRLLNVLLSGRLALYRTLVENLSFKDYLLGTPLITEGETIDNAYLHILFEGGLLGFVVFYYLYYKTIKSINKDSYYIVPIFVSFLSYGMTESIFTAVLYVGNMIIWFLMYRRSFNVCNE